MKDTIKRMLSRPIQLACYAVMGISTNHLLPKDPDVMQWVAYGFIYVALVALGADSYSEGFGKGIKIMEKLS